MQVVRDFVRVDGPNPKKACLSGSNLAGGEGGIGSAALRGFAPILTDCLFGLRPHRTGVLIPQTRLAPTQAVSLALERSELSNWRRGRDSNPRYLAVHCISNAARSTTLPPLLCYQLEGASKGGRGVGQGRRNGGPEGPRTRGPEGLIRGPVGQGYWGGRDGSPSRPCLGTVAGSESPPYLEA